MTIEDLKNNRTQIIKKLTALFGEKNLKAAMNMLKDAAEYSEMFNDGITIDAAIEDIEKGDFFLDKKMKLADYVAGLSENDSKTYAFNMNK